MKPPKCPVCQVEHWGVGHVWKDVSKPVKVNPGPKIVSNLVANTVSKVSKPSGTLPRVKLWRDKNREHYNELQREYMRKRRLAGAWHDEEKR
jgi:hypothetical protein